MTLWQRQKTLNFPAFSAGIEMEHEHNLMTDQQVTEIQQNYKHNHMVDCNHGEINIAPLTELFCNCPFADL